MTLPEGWREIRLGDLVDVLDGRRVPVSAAERATRHGSVPYFGAAGPVGFIDQPLFDEDLILLGEDGVQFFDPDRSKAYRVSGPAWVNNHAHVLRARPEVDWRFLTHSLNQVDYRGYVNGTTRLKLTQGAMRRIPIAIPSLEEQHRIIKILEEHLSSLDLANAALAAAERRAGAWFKSLLRALLARGDEASFAEMFEAVALPATSVEVRTASKGGRWPVVDQGAGEQHLRSDDEDAVHKGPLPVIVFGDHTRRLKMVHEPFAVGGSGVKILVARPGVDVEYAYWAARAVELPARGYGRHFALLRSADFSLGPLDFQQAVVREMREASETLDAARRLLEQAQRRAAALRRALLQAAFSGQLTGRASDLDRAEELTS